MDRRAHPQTVVPVSEGRWGIGRGLRWQTSIRANAEVCIALEGELDERADLRAIDLPAGPLVLELAGLRSINSSGGHQLVLLLETMPEDGSVAAEGCSPAVVAMLNLIPTFSRRIHVRSVVIPLECGRCLSQCEAVLDIGPERPPVLPELPCPECPGTMELAELPERYFAFLEESA